MGFLNRRSIKFIFGFLVILAISIAVLFVASNSQKNDDYDRQTQLAKEMEDKYRNDTYGGDTPEQTLQLFIDALKAGDTELASKYFVVDKQEEWKEKLEIGKEKGNLLAFLDILNKPKNGKEIYNGAYIFTFSENQEILMSIDLILNNSSNKWKIESL